jgi:hypothetical protein
MFLAADSAVGQGPPAIGTVTPLGVQPGIATDVNLRGSGLKGTTRLWTTLDVAAELTPDLPMNGEADDSATFRFAVPSDATPGLHGLRVVAPGGVSGLKLFLVDDLPGVIEVSGNGAPETAQPVSLPCAIDGRVDNLSRDYFRFDARVGQRVSFEVFARRIGSPLDPAIFLYRADGRELAYSDDAESLSGDCQMSYTFDADGAYVIEVRDIRYAGGDEHVYRLRIGDFPCVHTPFPLGVQRGVATEVTFAGTDVEGVAEQSLTVPSDWPHDWYPVSVRRSGGATSTFATVAVGDAAEFLEAEPNNSQEEANAVTLGDALNGRFAAPKDIDRYRFAATKGQKFRFQGVTRDEGAPTDLVLRILDASAKELAENDDEGTSEGKLDHTFAEDGEYVLEAADLHRRGGMPYAYRITVQPLSPGFALAAGGDTLNVPRGGVAALPVTVARQDFNGSIDVTADGLPEGLTADTIAIGPGMNSGVLTISATADATASAIPVTVVGTAKSDGADVNATASVTAHLKERWNIPLGVPQPVRRSVFAAVASAQAWSLRVEPGEVVVTRGAKAAVKIVVTRGEGIEEEIALATSPDKDALPKNVTLKPAPIPKGQTEVTLELAADDKAPLGTFSVVLTGAHKQGDKTTSAFAPAIRYRIEASPKADK